jgi:cobalt/nickel transport system permease protein
MHIPDGYLGPQTYGAMYAIMMPLWWRATVKVRKTLSKKNLPLIALAGAFSFVIMMFNIPFFGGTSGHAVGGALIAIVLGPWSALISISTALVIQALVFGDGGLTALAANCFTMAFVMPFSAFYIYKSVAGKTEEFGFRQRAGAFLAGYISLTLAAITTGVLFGLQPLIATDGGRALFSPYPLSVAVPAMALEHLVFFGPIEGTVTVLVLGFLVKADNPIRTALKLKTANESGGGA